MNRRPPAPLPAERRRAHAHAVEARSTLQYVTARLRGPGRPVVTSEDWLELARAAERAARWALDLRNLAIEAAAIVPTPTPSTEEDSNP